MAFTPITLTGSFPRPDGTLATGTGTATLSHRIINSGQVIEPTPITLHLSPAGLIVNAAGQPLVLEANDDPATQPPGTHYSFALQIDGAPLDPFEAVIPHLAPGATVDISTLIPALG